MAAHTKDYRCAECKGQLEATRKIYLSLDTSHYRDRNRFLRTSLGPDYVFYCASSCFEYETGGVIDLANPAAILPILVNLGYAEEGEPE